LSALSDLLGFLKQSLACAWSDRFPPTSDATNVTAGGAAKASATIKARRAVSLRMDTPFKRVQKVTVQPAPSAPLAGEPAKVGEVRTSQRPGC
jgi:hypothetical protein